MSNDRHSTMADKVTEALGLAKGSGSAAIRRKYAIASDEVRAGVAVAMGLPGNANAEAIDVTLEKLLTGLDATPAVVAEATAARTLTSDQLVACAAAKCSARDFVAARAAIKGVTK